MQRSFEKQDVSAIKGYKDGTCDTFCVTFEGKFVCEFFQDVWPRSLRSIETMYWRVYQLPSKKIAVFANHNRMYENWLLDTNLYIYDNVEEIENIKQIEGVSTDDLCRLIRESMIKRRNNENRNEV